MPPSFVPARPSALLFCPQSSFHFAPAATTPGISITVTSLAGAGCGKRSSCAVTAWLVTKASPRNIPALMNVLFNLITSSLRLVRRRRLRIPVSVGESIYRIGNDTRTLRAAGPAIDAAQPSLRSRASQSARTTIHAVRASLLDAALRHRDRDARAAAQPRAGCCQAPGATHSPSRVHEYG